MKKFPVEMFLIIFHLSVVSVVLSLTVQQTVSNFTRVAPLEIQTVEMEERISKLMSLFKLTPDTATAVVFGHHSRYLCKLLYVDCFFFNPLSQTFSGFAICET